MTTGRCAAVIVAVFSVGGCACAGKSRSPEVVPADGSEPASAAVEPEGPVLGDAVDHGAPKKPGAASLVVRPEWLWPPVRHRKSPGVNGCGRERRPPIEVHLMGGVRWAVVELTAREGQKVAPDEGGAVIEMAECELSPPVAVMAPGELQVVNSDERQALLTLAPGEGAEGARQVMPLRVVGHSYRVQLQKPGLFRLSADRTEDRPSYVLVTEKLARVTGNELGEAIFDEIPAGKYGVRVWHPPLADGGAALVVESDVELKPGKAAQLRVPLGVSTR